MAVHREDAGLRGLSNTNWLIFPQKKTCSSGQKNTIFSTFRALFLASQLDYHPENREI